MHPIKLDELDSCVSKYIPVTAFCNHPDSRPQRWK